MLISTGFIIFSSIISPCPFYTHLVCFLLQCPNFGFCFKAKFFFVMEKILFKCLDAFGMLIPCVNHLIFKFLNLGELFFTKHLRWASKNHAWMQLNHSFMHKAFDDLAKDFAKLNKMLLFSTKMYFINIICSALYKSIFFFGTLFIFKKL